MEQNVNGKQHSCFDWIVFAVGRLEGEVQFVWKKVDNLNRLQLPFSVIFKMKSKVEMGCWDEVDTTVIVPWLNNENETDI